MNGLELPRVDPMMVRSFTLRDPRRVDWYGDVMVMDDFDVTEVGIADARLDYDEAVVDCSNRMFQITTRAMMQPDDLVWTVVPSRRWRNHRVGMEILTYPDDEHPLLYIGNPILVTKDKRGIQVISGAEFLIKSGPELGY